MEAPRYDLTIEKGATFYREFQITTDAQGKSLVGKNIVAIFKDSTATGTETFNLTEANGGIIVIDDPDGGFAISINADLTNVDSDYGIYYIVSVDDLQPLTIRDTVLNGKVTYKKGTA